MFCCFKRWCVFQIGLQGGRFGFRLRAFKIKIPQQNIFMIIFALHCIPGKRWLTSPSQPFFLSQCSECFYFCDKYARKWLTNIDASAHSPPLALTLSFSHSCTRTRTHEHTLSQALSLSLCFTPIWKGVCEQNKTLSKERTWKEKNGKRIWLEMFFFPVWEKLAKMNNCCRTRQRLLHSGKAHAS